MNDRLTSISEISGLPIVSVLQESCGEDSCADACAEYCEKGCVGCPVQAAISKLYEIEHPQPLTHDEIDQRIGRPAWLVNKERKEPVIIHSVHSHDVVGHGVTVTNWSAAKKQLSDGENGKTWWLYDHQPKDVTP